MTLPVALFTYNRPRHLSRLVESLRRNPEAPETRLFIFSDGPKNPVDSREVEAVRRFARQINGFAGVELVEREHNLGCAASVIDGVSRVLAHHDRLIVVEDDLRLSSRFLAYMNAALDRYQARRDIFSVSAFAPLPDRIGMPQHYRADVYLSRRNASWGWGTWADRWCQVDWDVRDYPIFCRDRRRRRAFDLGGNDLSLMLDAQMAGRIDSWAVRFSYAHFISRAYSVCPRWSYTDHTGDDGSGTHVPDGGGCRSDLSLARAKPHLPPDLQPDAAVLEALRCYYSEHWLSAALGTVPGVRPLVRRVKNWFGISKLL